MTTHKLFSPLGLFFMIYFLGNNLAFSQVLFSENFNGALTWNLNGDGNAMIPSSPPANGASANTWVRNASGPATIDGTANLHISCLDGSCDNTSPVQPSGTKFNATTAAHSTNRVAFMTSSFPASAFAGTDLRLEFQWICNNAFPTATPGMRMVFSVNNGATWSDYNQTFTGASTIQTASIPVNATQFPGLNMATPNLRIGFRWFNEGPAVAPRPSIDNGIVVDNLVIRNIASASVTLNPGTGTLACQGAQIPIDYTATGFPAATTFILELSNAVGSFAAPTNLGTLGTSPFNITIPANTTPGAGYRIRIRASDGTLSNVQNLEIRKLPNPFITGNPSICSGTPTQLNGNPQNNVTYTWILNNNPIGGATSNTLQANTAGSYTLRVDSLGCSRTSAALNVTNQVSPNAQIAGAANVTVCMNGATPIATVLRANAGIGLSYQWTRNGTPVFPNGTRDSLVIISAGTYRVEVTSTTTGCRTTSAAVTATESQIPPVPNAGLDSAFCSGTNVSAGFLPGPAFAGLTFSWIPTTGVLDFFTGAPSPNSPLVRITGTNTGAAPVSNFYRLFVIDPATGCRNSDEVKITINPNPQNVTGGENRTVCENGLPIALIGLPASTPANQTPQGIGEWTGAGISVVGNQVLFTPSPALVGANTLRYTYRLDWKNGGQQCTNFAEKLITVNPAPQVQPGDPRSFCKGIDSVQLTGFTPAFPTGRWSGPSISQRGMFYPAALPVGTYVCTLSTTNAQGCTGFGTRTLTVTPPIAIDAGPISQSLCSNLGSYQMTGFTPPAGSNGRWTSSTIPISTGGALTFDSSRSGIHILRYTFERDGCKSVDSVFMTIITAPKARVGKNDSICANDLPRILLGATPAGGRWKGPGVDSTGSVFTPSPALIGAQPLLYKVTLNNCPDSAIRIMFVKSAPIVNAGKNDTICAGLDSLKMSGFFPSLGKWSGTGVDSLGVFRPKKFNLVGNFTLTYTVRSSNGCTGRSEKQVTVFPLPQAIAGLDTALCTGGRVQLGGAPLPHVRYKWFEPVPNSISNDTISNPFISIVNTKQKPDTFFVRLRVTDTITKCLNRDTVRVIVYPKPVSVAVFPGVKTRCFGDSFIMRARTRPGLLYEWLRNGFSLNIPSEKDSVLKIGLSGKYQLVVRNAGASCTDSSLTDSLAIFPRFIPRITGFPRFCKDSTTTLRVQPANEGFTYEWQYNGVNVPDSNATTFTIGKTGTVRVILRTDRGCRDSSAIVPIDSLPFPKIGILNDTTICERGTATFKVQFDSLYNYRWIDSSTKNILSQEHFLKTSKAGKYYVEVYNFCNTVRDSAELIRVYPLPRFSILNNGRGDTVVCENLPVRLFGPVGYASYEWTTDSLGGSNGRQFIVPTNKVQGFTLRLRVVDDFSCSNSDTIRVKVIDCAPKVYVPTAFTPQGDRINDVWRLTGYDIMDFKLYVYNRWGQMVYYSTNINQGWDGNFNDSPCPSGAYKWVVEYKGLLDGEEITKKETGTVTIIR